jgi:hypothetical protein
MKTNSIFLSRCFQYFQQGFALLSLPISLVSTATIFYYLLIAHFTFFHVIFPEFIYFLGIGALIFIPTATTLGWYYTKRSKVYGSQVALLTEVNPLGVHSTRLQMEQQIDVLKALGIQPTDEYLKLDDEKRWRP